MDSRTIQVLEFFAQPRDFVWGKTDCCLWVADILKALHGVDYAENLRGTYSSRRDFAALLIKEEKKNLLELLIPILGIPVKGSSAKLGHPLLTRVGEETALGMCYGTYGLFLTDAGYTRRSLDNCMYSWEI